jgi:hyperosmotically inducible periplasmic protein
MKVFADLKFFLIALLLAIGLGACDEPGPAEKAGKNIDQTMDKVGQEIVDAADKVKKQVNE